MLSVYDDDRAKELRSGARALAWRDVPAETAVARAPWRRARAPGLRFLISPTTSPLLGDLRRRILERFPAAKFVSYASLADDGAVEGAKMAFGKPLVPRLKAAPAERDPVARRRLPGRGHRTDASVRASSPRAASRAVR